MKRFLYILLFFVGIFNLYAQDTTINWLSFDSVRTAFAKNQKPILIFAYSKDDSLSKKMMDETLSLGELANYINVLFYPIKLDVKTNDTITFFSGKTYTHQAGEQYHSIAKMLIGDTVSTPALILFGKNAIGTVYPGFMNRDSIFPLLIYYAEDIYFTHTLDKWKAIYYKAYPPGQKQIINRLYIKWMTFNEMLEKEKTEPRLAIVDIYNKYSVAQTIMRTQVYNDPEIAKYINQHFYPVTLALRSDEVFKFQGKTFKNSMNPAHYHEFAIAALDGKMKFPAFVIIDENQKLIDRIQFFVTKDEMEPIIHYYGDGAYKTMKFPDYLKQWKKLKPKTN